jgi:hypothetical protein
VDVNVAGLITSDFLRLLMLLLALGSATVDVSFSMATECDL